MNEEKYTRDPAKKSARRGRKKEDHKSTGSHGEKLKNDSSAETIVTKSVMGKKIIPFQ